MSSNINYYRAFIMMQEEDKGIGQDGNPTGYVKIEVKNGYGKILVHVQNISKLSEGSVLKAYLLSSKMRKMQPLCLGTIVLKGSSGDVTYLCNKNVFRESSLDISDFDTVVVVYKETGENGKAYAFPLVGYKNGKWTWKSAMVGLEAKDVISSIEESDQKNEESKEYTGNMESVTDTCMDSKNEPVAEEPIFNELMLDNVKEQEAECSKKDEGKASVERVTNEVKEKDTYTKEHRHLYQILNKLSKNPSISQPFNKEDYGYEWWRLNDCRFILDHLYQDLRPGNRQNTIFLLNNLMVLNSIYVISVVRRYGYYLFGIKHDAERGIQCISYAIPSKYGLDPHPLLQVQTYAYWIPQKGETPAIGAMGYWVVKLNAQTGEFFVEN